MAFPFGAGSLPQVGKLIELFTAMGCELHKLESRLIEQGGSEEVSFLYNPETEGFASLSGLDDGDHVPWSVVESWERALDVAVPRPPQV